MSRRRSVWKIDLSGAIVHKTLLPKNEYSDQKKATLKARREEKRGQRFCRLPIVADRRDRYEVVITDWLPSTLNAMFRGKFHNRKRLEEQSHEIVGRACLDHGVALALQRRKVSLRLGILRWDHESDRDASYKALFDSLVGCGALVSDRCSGVEIGPLEFYIASRPVTIIVLEDIGPCTQSMNLDSGWPFARSPVSSSDSGPDVT